MRHSPTFALTIVLATAALALAQPDPPGRVARLNYMSGTVSFQPGGVDDWVPAAINRPLTTGDHLWVDEGGRAEMHIGTAALRLNAHTAFEFLNLDDQTAQIRLAEGSLEIRLRRLDENQAFEVDTPNLAFSLLRPGTYRIEANPDTQTTTVTVRSGEGEVTGGGQAFAVRPQQQARITGDQSLTYDLAAAPLQDEFDNFCGGRDRREDQSRSAQYVSRDMVGYEDLDDAGDWRPEPEYGAVWYPRAVPAGWSPYRFGHWAWIEPWGWTWVDDAPWGFAPFHYGRWAYIGGAWGWIPGPIAVRPVYAPALVAWVGGPHFNLSIGVGGGVAWFPLGPREVYVPGYRVSRAYVSRINVVNVYNVTNVYVNRTAPGAVTAVPSAAFVRARPVHREMMNVDERAMVSAQVVEHAPVAPVRESVVGRPRIDANVARPPAAVISRPVVARETPPPPPAPFERRQAFYEQQPGRPLEPAAARQLRGSAPARSYIRPAQSGNAPAAGGFAQPPQDQAPIARPPRPRPDQPRYDRPLGEPRPAPTPQPQQPAPQSPPSRTEQMRRVEPADHAARPAPANRDRGEQKPADKERPRERERQDKERKDR